MTACWPGRRWCWRGRSRSARTRSSCARSAEEFGAIPATAASTVVGAVPYLAAAGTLPGAGLAQLGPAVWAELAFLALGSTAAGLLLWNVAALSGGVTRVSLLLYLEPVVSVVGAAVFLGERVTLVMIGGGLLILAGVAVSGTGRDMPPLERAVTPSWASPRPSWPRRPSAVSAASRTVAGGAAINVRRPTRESRSARPGG